MSGKVFELLIYGQLVVTEHFVWRMVPLVGGREKKLKKPILCQCGHNRK